MRSLFLLSSLFCCLTVSQYGFSAENVLSPAPIQGSVQGTYQGSADGCCPADAPCGEQRLNDCYCLYVAYDPCYYTTKRCVETQVPCTKKCYRKVPQYYEVQRCKMVPQYYCETKCRYVTECYEVADTKCCKEYVCDTHCKYVPRYYWKHTCGDDVGCTTPAPAACGPQGCPSPR